MNFSLLCSYNLVTFFKFKLSWLEKGSDPDSDTIYTIYLSLCTQTADPKFPNPFRGTHCISTKSNLEPSRGLRDLLDDEVDGRVVASESVRGHASEDGRVGPLRPPNTENKGFKFHTQLVKGLGNLQFEQLESMFYLDD